MKLRLLLLWMLFPVHLPAQTAVDWGAIASLREQGRLEEALALLEAYHGPATLQTARERQLLLHDLQRFSQAQDAGRRWILLARRSGDPGRLAEALYHTGNSYGAQGRIRESLDHFREALEVLPEDADSRLETQILIRLATAEQNSSLFASSHARLDRAETLWRESGDPLLGSRIHLARATAFTLQERHWDALTYLEKARELGEKAGDQSLLITILTNLGQVQMRLHNYLDSVAILNRALELQQGDVRRALILASIGICHFEMNQFEQAAEAFEEARLAAVAGGNRRLEAWAIGELGIVHWKGEGDAERSEQAYDRAVRLFEETGDRRNALVFLENKASLLRDQGRLAEAVRLYREVERRTRQVPELKPSANLYKSLGQCLAGLGRLAEAERLLRTALDRATETGDSKRVWQSHLELAAIHRKKGKSDQADASYRAALDAIESTRDTLRFEGFKRDFFSDKVQAYAEYVGFLTESGEAGRVRNSYEIAQRARARSLLDALAESRAGLDELLPPEVLLEEQSILGEISEMQARMRAQPSNSELNRELRAREQSLEDLHVRVRAEHPRYRGLRYPRPAPLVEIQSSLRPDELILEYLIADGASYLWLIDSRAVRCTRLPGRKDLEAAVRKELARLVQPGPAPPDLHSLAGSLLGPLAEDETPPSSLIVIPSGILHHFPFETLPGGRAKAPLIESSRVSYLPTASMLVEERRTAGRGPAEPRLLALGDPVYEEGPAQARAGAPLRLQSLGAIPHTRGEVLAIRSHFGARRSTLLLGRDASEQKLKSLALENYTVLHLAAHGWIDPGMPSRSGLILGLDPDSPEDGLLQVREIFRLSLNASLVTLSACQSALGRLVTGEGMVGLTRAFFHAGADSVVASLWNVNDEGTASFMSEFYGRLKDGQPKAEALREAKLIMRRDPRWSHPYYWAPYVLIGEGSDPVEFPRSWIPFAFAAAAFLVAAYAAWRRYRARRSR